jgi:hypothetical protein
MIRRGFRSLSLFALVALLGTMFPFVAAAQFPSQDQGGGTEPSSGGFPSQGAGAGRGGFFQGTEFAWEIAWGPEWTLVDQGADQGFEAVSLSNGVSDITLGAFTLQDTPQNVVINTADVLGEGTWEFAEVVFDEPDRAAAYFNGPDGQGHFIDVIGTGPSSAVFLIWSFPGAQYDAEWERFLALMDGFQWSTSG